MTSETLPTSKTKRLNYWSAQCIFWGSYAAANITIFIMSATPEPILWTVFILLTTFLVVASHSLRALFKRFATSWPIVKTIVNAVWLVLVSAIVIQGIIFIALNVFIKTQPSLVVGMAPYSWASFIGYVINTAIALGAWTILYLFISQYRLRRTTELAYWKTQAQLRDTELQFLHNQINSHFLFNAMNNVRALILEDPELARERLTQLANILRSTFSANNKDLITLSEELDIVKAYLDLESLQYENRMTTDINIDQSLQHCKIPPMLLQTLVENAVRHGIAHSPNGGRIEIFGCVENRSANITIRNPIASNSQPGHGVGLENTRLRLEKAFAEQAKLEIQQQNNDYVVLLKLPL